MNCIHASILLAVAVSPVIAADDESHLKRVDQLFAKYDRPDLPGCSVAVIREGKVVYRKSFGSANLEHEVLNTSKTIFEIGSSTKSFVSACIAVLLDEGKLSPDDDVRMFLPELHRHKTPIRIKHLIRCRSGTWDHWHAMQLAGWSSEPIESPYTAADALQLLAGQKTLPFEPGTKFKYGSGDYFLLGQIVQRVTGKSLAAFARARLFQPLGMTRTYFETDPTRIVKGRATGYYKGPRGRWRRWQTNSSGIGGWGLKTCADDLIRWNRNFEKSRLPKGKYLDAFLKTGSLLNNVNCLDGSAGRKYRGLKRMQFTGGMPGFRAALTRFPEKKLTVICLANNGEIRPQALNTRIADVYLFDKPAAPAKAQRPDETKPVQLTAAQLRDKVGAWRTGYGYIFRIEFKDGRLHFVHHLNQKYALKPLSETHFEPVGYPAPGNTLVFSRASPKHPYTLSLQWPRGRETYQPVMLIQPTGKQLRDYAGEYFSGELQTTYRFRVRDGRLWLRINSRRWEPLAATVRDELIPHVRRAFDNRVMAFRRDKKGKVTSVVTGLWRVQGVVFKRRRWKRSPTE